MAVDPKPNDPSLNDLTWAESQEPPTAPESDTPTKPNPDFIEKGFGNRDVLPHASFNWLIRSMMRWIRWLVSKADNHVHDGLNNDQSAPKVNASNHLDWGEGGSLTVTTASNVHIITHSGTAATRRIVAQQLQASTIRSVGQGETASVTIRDSGGSNGFLNSPILQTDTIRRNATGAGAINVRASDGANSTTLNVATLQTSTIRATTSGTNAAINVRDSNGNNGRLDVYNLDVGRDVDCTRRVIARQDVSSNVIVPFNSNQITRFKDFGNNFIPIQAENVPVAVAYVQANPFTLMNNKGVHGTSFIGFSADSTRESTGIYRLTLAAARPNLSIHVTPRDVYTPTQFALSRPIIAVAAYETTAVPNATNIRVRTFNKDGLLVDCNFFITVYAFS